jgi:hypothetical protein
MARTNFLAPLSLLGFAGIIPLAIACNGHVVSMGSTGNTLSSVAPTKAQTSVEPTSPVTCATGWAHPNICCESSANTPTSCGAWDDNPFQKCESGWTTYPNQTSCCQLSNPSSCVSTPAATGPSTSTSGPSGSSSGSSSSTPPTPPPAYGCGFACPPGWWSQAIASSTNGPTAPGCCMVEASGALTCTLQGEQEISTPACAGTTVPTPSEDGGPVLDDDGGYYAEDAGTSYDDAGTSYDDASTTYEGCDDAGSSYWPGYDGGATSLCYACPAGWAASDPLQPELCCQTLPDGVTTLCFSQATGWASSTGSSGTSNSSGSSGSTSPPIEVDASIGSNPTGASWATSGANAPDGGPSGPSCTGSSSTASCDETVNGHTYALDCYAGTQGAVTCTCTVDGTATSATPSVDSCEDENAVEAAFSTGCSFP